MEEAREVIGARAMTRLLVINDLHLADKPIGRRIGDYRAQMFAKLEECWSIYQKAKCDALIVTGDIFHYRGARVSHSLVGELLEYFSLFDDRAFLILGNHDMVGGNPDSVEDQPLGVLLKAGVVHVLGLKRRGMVLKDVCLYGRHYSYDEDKDYYCGHNSPSDKIIVEVCHGMIVPPGEKFYGTYTDMSEINTGSARLYLYGHPHWDSGVRKVKGVYFACCGALSRGTMHEYNLYRQVKVLLVQADTGLLKFKAIPLKSALPVEKVFDFGSKGKDEAKKQIKSYVDFITAETTGTAIESADLNQWLDNLLIDADVRSVVEEYLEKARS